VAHEELERDLQRFWQTGALSESEKAGLKNLRFALRRRLGLKRSPGIAQRPRMDSGAAGVIDAREAVAGGRCF
jgi:hypothetical protein